MKPHSMPLEVFEDIIDENEIDLELEEEHPIIAEIQAKYNQLNERFISLKATAESLKQQIHEEKDRWHQELEETIQLERQFKERQKKHYEMIMPTESEMKRKYEIFKDFLFFSQATETIETLTRKHGYQQWLNEVESECSLELNRIQKSLTALKPLRDIASQWKSGNFSCDVGITEIDKGADGDKNTEIDKDNDITVIKKVRSTKLNKDGNL